MSTTENTLKITADPSAVYASASNQVSLADITITINNPGSDLISITEVGILLPANLYAQGSEDSISPSAGQDTLWNFSSPDNGADFQAIPVSGNAVPLLSNGSFTFSMNGITVNSSTGTANINVTVLPAAGSPVKQQLQVPIDQPTQSVSLTAMPTLISPGEASKLTWSCPGMDYCIITPLSTDHQQPSGSQFLGPDLDTTYTLDGFAEGIHLQTQVTISVKTPQVKSFYMANADQHGQVDYNSPAQFVWTINAYTDYVELTSVPQFPIPDPIPLNIDPANPLTGAPLTIATQFTLTPVSNTIQQHLPVGLGIDIKPPSLIFTASTNNTMQGDSVVLKWNAESAANVQFTAGTAIGQPQPLQGSITVNPATTTTYTIQVTGGPGTGSSGAAAVITLSQTINVTPVTLSFPAPATILLSGAADGNQVTLTWTSNAPKLSLNNNIGDVSGKSTVVIKQPADGAVYTLTAGTEENPSLISESITIVNTYGPFGITSIANTSSPWALNGDGPLTPGFQALISNTYTEQPFCVGYTPNLQIQFSGITISDGSAVNPQLTIAGFSLQEPLYLVSFYETPGTGGESGVALSPTLGPDASVLITALLPTFPVNQLAQKVMKATGRTREELEALMVTKTPLADKSNS